MKILDLPVKKEWYEMIECGEKPEEYRSIKPYWCRRLGQCLFDMCWVRDNDGQCHFRKNIDYINRPGYTHVRFRFGYTMRNMLFTLDGIRIGIGNPEWGAPENKDVFILKLGKRLY